MLPPVFTIVIALVSVAIIGGAYTVTGEFIARGYGRNRVLLWWTGSSVFIGAMAAIRAIAQMEAAGIERSRISILGNLTLGILMLAIILSAPTLVVLRRATDVRKPRHLMQGLLGGAAAIGGLIFVVVLAFALESVGVNFVPFN